MAQDRSSESTRESESVREDAPEPVPVGAATGSGGDGMSAATAAAAQNRDFFGHPRGLATLFFTEFWERFSYYGMRALLVLFMTAAATGIANEGLGLDVGAATAIYGLYTFFVYVMALPGGWVADNLWGQRRSVFVGGCIIALGHFTMAGPLVGLPDRPSFFAGLILIVIGTGLLKPNVSTMVGELYPEGGARRDAGFSIFYMGINFGAILGPTLCGILGEGYNWHWGFSLAGFGMLAGLVSYRLGVGNLGEAGTLKTDDTAVVARKSRNFYLIAAAVTAVVVAFGFMMSTGLIGLSLKGVASLLGVGVLLGTVLFFVYLVLGRAWMIPTVLAAVAVFAVAYPFLERSTFEETARGEVRGELQQMIGKNRLETGRIESVSGLSVAELDTVGTAPDETVPADQQIAGVEDLNDDQIGVLVGEMSDANVLALMDMTPADIERLGQEKLYERAAQVAIAVTILLFLLVVLARLLAPQVTVTRKKKRLVVIFWLFLLAALFWSGFEQAGTSFNLFALESTDRTFGPYGVLQAAPWLMTALVVAVLAVPVGIVCYRVFRRANLWWAGRMGVGLLSAVLLGAAGYAAFQLAGEWTLPASVLQNINPTFIVILAPVFGATWTWLANRNANPSIPVKFALGLFGLAAGFFVISWGAANTSGPNSVSIAWLVVTYFLHTCGELCLSPVGLSSMTKLAPENRVGQMMGVWFVAAALGNLIAGLIAGQLETLPAQSLFFAVACIIGGGGVVALLAAPFVKRLMGDVE